MVDGDGVVGPVVGASVALSTPPIPVCVGGYVVSSPGPTDGIVACVNGDKKLGAYVGRQVGP